MDSIFSVLYGKSLLYRKPVRSDLRSGFTLMELLVVIAVIGVLSTLLIPGLRNSMEQGKQSKCTQHLRQAALKFMHEDLLPPSPPTSMPTSPDQPRINPGCPYCNPPWAPPRFQQSAAETRSKNANFQEAAGLFLNDPLYCPKAPRNPAWVLDPDRQPERISFGVFDGFLEGHENGRAWMLADADTTFIGFPSELAFRRHQGRANVASHDGSVRPVNHSDFQWPFP